MSHQVLPKLSPKLPLWSFSHLASQTPQISVALGFPAFLECAMLSSTLGLSMAVLHVESSTTILYWENPPSPLRHRVLI